MAAFKDLSEVPLYDLVLFGATLRYLSDISLDDVKANNKEFKHLAGNHASVNYGHTEVKHQVEKFKQYLEDFGLTKCLGTAGSLDWVLTKIKDHHENIDKTYEKQIAAFIADVLVNTVNHTWKTLKAEADSRRLCEIDRTALSPAIMSFQATVLNTPMAMQDWQAAFWEDTIRCLRVGAYRPAVVVGWATGYDMMRFWVHKDTTGRLKDFNAELISRNEKPINHFEDFFSMKEDRFLDYCRLAKGSLSDFTDKTHRKLQILLDERNEFGHANFREATAMGVQSLLEKMIAILTSKPFLL